jgi:signal recognition particle receptor subunit beta
MVLFNYATKEITAKIVYYGPGLCGKTTNLQFVYDSLPSNNKSKMLSLATKTDRTLFFDFLPLDLGKIRGMRTKLQLYTVPGQVYYNSTRQLVLKGADGVVFVADSQDFALDANLESLQNLEDNLKRQGIRLREMPLVLQYNKRDLPNHLPTAEIDKELNKLQSPTFESVATTGLGVEETLKGITQLVLAHLVKKYGLEGSGPLDKEIQILNAPTQSATPAESLWDDEDEPFGSTVVTPPPSAAKSPVGSQASASKSAAVSAITAPAAARAAAPPPARATPPPPSRSAPVGEAEFELDEDADENIPLIATELVGAGPATPANPFDDVTDYFNTFGRSTLTDTAPANDATEVPTTSIEIPLPAGILDSLPILGEGAPATTVATAPERRSTDGLVREVTIPLNLSVEEIRQHRRLRLKITLDVNLLP